MMTMIRLCRHGGILLLLLFTQLVSADDFPRPASLQPAVEFWTRVYTEIHTDQGFIHDSRDLSRVFDIAAVPQDASRRTRRALVKKAINRVKTQLNRIAKSDRNKLSAADQKLLKQFPANVSAAEIRRSAKRLRFQRGQSNKFRDAIARSGYYNQHIKKILRQKGLPEQLAALPFVESSFNIRAYSHVGAAGIWQFMPATGRRFMTVNHVIDERYDPYRASYAAADLLKYNYGVLGSWPLALTAYNHGVGGMRRAVRKTGSRDIGVIVKHYSSRSFGFASRNFYAEFLAALDISQNPEHFFPGVKPYSARKFAEFKLDHYVPANALAEALDVPVSELRQHNLALREPVWDGEKHIPAGFSLRVPAQDISPNVSQLLAAIPATERHAQQVPDVSYKVRRGDSLSRIASHYNVSVTALVRMNNLRSRHRIRAGQVLLLPGQAGEVDVAQAVTRAVVNEVASVKEDVPAVIADTEPVPPVVSADILVEDEVEESLRQINATDPAEYGVDENNTIEVQAAETLGHYADWLKVSVKKLRQINRLSRKRSIIIGKRILLDFSRVSAQEFEGKRVDYHKQLEDAFFAANKVDGTRQYRIRRGDSLWVIANKRTRAPLWLIRQYNPDVDFAQLKPGQAMQLPVVSRKG